MKIRCLLGFHKWLFVGRRTIFDILNGKGKTNYICKYCGKENKMKTRFKFRFWRWQTDDEGNGLIRIQCLADLMSVDGSAEPYDDGEGGAYCYFDDTICEQCTGFTDKNLKLIYEGDIVELDDTTETRLAVIKWCYDTGRWDIETNDNVYSFDNLYNNELTVVGNIHENADLLEESK